MNDAILGSICGSAGLSVKATSLFESSRSVGKELLRKNTELAVSSGMFGSPTFVIHVDAHGLPSDKETVIVFGSDRFEQISFLLGKKWLGPNPEEVSKPKIDKCKL